MTSFGLMVIIQDPLKIKGPFQRQHRSGKVLFTGFSNMVGFLMKEYKKTKKSQEEKSKKATSTKGPLLTDPDRRLSESVV